MKLLNILRKLKIFFIMNTKTKVLIIKAFILTGKMRYLILNVDFKELKEDFGTSKNESSYKINNEIYKKAKLIGWVVCTVSKYTPWESLCLVQAMTAQKLLKDERIDSTLYLGINKGKNEIKAHAWLRCGEYYVTGGNGEKYIKVASFS